MLPKLTADEHQAWRIYKAFRSACQANKVKNLWQVTNLGFNDLSQIDDFDRVRSHRNWHHYVGTWKTVQGLRSLQRTRTHACRLQEHRAR